MKVGQVFILSGPSGAGKTTLYKRLLASPRLKRILVKSISATTRPRRENEKHGRDYLFLDKRDFLAKKRRGYFIESQRVFQHYYGTPKSGVDKILRAGKNVLLCIDVKGAKVVWRKCPVAVRIFIKPPSLAALRKRLQKRDTETPASLKIRLETAQKELKEAKHYHHIVINDKLETAYKRLEKIVLGRVAE